MSEGGDSGAVDSDSKPGMGVGHCWGWEAADEAEGDSLKMEDCLGEVAGCSDGSGMLGMYGGGTGGSSSGSPCRIGLVSFWSLGFISWAMKTLFCPFLLVQNLTQGAWSEAPEARRQYRGTVLGVQGFLLQPEKRP
jgi:hypothetical protein